MTQNAMNESKAIEEEFDHGMISKRTRVDCVLPSMELALA